VAVVLLVIVAVGAFAHWSISVRAPGNKRVTEMGVFVGVQELEKVKARRFLGTAITPANAPLVSYYDKHGKPDPADADRFYKVKTWNTTLVDRDASANTEDLREVKIEVWDLNETAADPYETIRTLMSFGGI
jgi:hypothetical protein